MFTGKFLAMIPRIIFVLSYLLVLCKGAPQSKVDLQLIEQFRNKMKSNLTKDYMKTDLYLTKWLKLANLNLKEAEKKLIEHCEWRKEHELDTILKKNLSDTAQDFPHRIDSYDKRGRPVGYVDFGKWHLRDAAVQGRSSYAHAHFLYFMEQLNELLYKVHENRSDVEDTLIIVDLDGMSKVQHLCPSCLGVFLLMADTLDNHYPYIMEQLIFINAPQYFQMTYQNTFVFMTKRVIDTWKVLGDPSVWMPYLDSLIDRNERYNNYGGTKGYINGE